MLPNQNNKNNNNNKIIDIFLQTFVKHISIIPNIQNFILIGDSNFLIDDSEISYEIHCRYYKSGNEGELEILFNDVTRTKINEKQNAEFKYKTLFLSKVAHEFKNPLICITELINQSFDCFPYMADEGNIKKILNKTFFQIKSLSNFLLIMVRDLNYFSECQLGKDAVLEKKETDLKEVINFCKDVAQSLLKRSGKSENVDLVIDIENDVPEKIMTDEWRLKQVIINLLSNAVKFTLFGQILLTISLEKQDEKYYVKFTVKDTGVGIKEEQQKNIFKPFQKGLNKNNEMGSGLGLSIANEIASKLGTRLQFQSKTDNGSVFWFSIPYESYFNPPEINKNFIKSLDIQNEKIFKETNSIVFYDFKSEGGSEKYCSKSELIDSDSVNTRKLEDFVLTNKNIPYVPLKLVRNKRPKSLSSSNNIESQPGNLYESFSEINFKESPTRKFYSYKNLISIPMIKNSSSDVLNKNSSKTSKIKNELIEESEDKNYMFKKLKNNLKNFNSKPCFIIKFLLTNII
jgi:signal transduction histidine kinase